LKGLVWRVRSVLMIVMFNSGLILFFCVLRLCSFFIKKIVYPKSENSEKRGILMQKLFGLFSRIFVRYWCILQIRLKEVPKNWSSMGASGRGVLLIMNHSSLFDIVAVASILPLDLSQRLRFVVSNGVLLIPIIGQVIEGMNAIFVRFAIHDNSKPKNACIIKGNVGLEHEGSFKLVAGASTQVKDAIITHTSKKISSQQGSGITLICPEGTIGAQGGKDVLPFRKGIFQLALDADLEIHALVLAGVSAIWAPRANYGGTSSASIRARLIPIAPSGAKEYIRDNQEKHFFLSARTNNYTHHPSYTTTTKIKEFNNKSEGQQILIDDASRLAHLSRCRVQTTLDILNNCMDD